MRVVAVVMLGACGRLGFDATPSNGDAAHVDDGAPSDTSLSDGPTIACADINLGSALGRKIHTGSTAGAGNQTSACDGDGPELAFGWFAPTTGTYVFDLCDSDPSWDSVMYIRDGACAGAELACGDDGCGGAAGLQPRLTLNLTAGQGVVIFVDSQFTPGTYALSITQP